MEGSKIKLTKATLRFVISNLTAQDEFGLVSFASDIQEALKLQKMDAAGRRRALQAVDAIQADGCTNLSGGLFAGIDQLKGVPITQTDVPRRRRPVVHRVQARAPVGPGLNSVPAGPMLSFQVGNDCVKDADGATVSWTLFVRLAEGMASDVSEYVDHVQFHIPSPDGTPQAITVAQAPFVLSRVTEIATAIDVQVTLTAKYNSAVHSFQHTPNFSSPLTYCTVQVPDVSQPAVPEISTTPPSQPAVTPSEAASSSAGRNDVTAVWLFTDGLANEGIQDQAELTQQTQQRLQGMAPPCTIFTFGFGEDHNAQMLKDVADAGKGMYYYVQSEAAIVESFGDCLGGLMSVVARELRLTAVPSSGVVPQRIFTPYTHHVAADEAWVIIPDLYCEEERDLVMEVEVGPADPAYDAPAPILHWRLDYRNLLTDQDDTLAACSELARPVEAPADAPHPLLDQQRNRVRCTDAIQQARVWADHGELAQAQRHIEEAMAAINTSPTAGVEFCAGLVEDLQDCRDQMSTQAEYYSRGSKTMMNNHSTHSYQRCCGSKQKYVTSAKAQMTAHFQTNLL